jgi:signal transduction histidine kinase
MHGEAVSSVQKVLIRVRKEPMKPAPKHLARHAAGLVLLLAVASVVAARNVAPPLGWAVALWGLLACASLALVRATRRDQFRLDRMQAQLASERRVRAEAEQALAHAHGMLCRLVREQAGVRDAERSRIARDIHDDLGQNLLALRIELSLMQVAASAIEPALHQKLGLMGRNLDLAIRSLRAVVNNLRPLALGEGLRCAMERQLAEFSRVSGIVHEFDASDAAFDALAPQCDTDAMLYRVLQESLSNVARHAQASRVRVAFGIDGERLCLRVADNGVGMAASTACGCGLNGIRERASAAGGALAIDSAPGAGLALTLSIPVPGALSPVQAATPDFLLQIKNAASRR